MKTMYDENKPIEFSLFNLHKVMINQVDKSRLFKNKMIRIMSHMIKKLLFHNVYIKNSNMYATLCF